MALLNLSEMKGDSTLADKVLVSEGRKDGELDITEKSEHFQNTRKLAIAN